MVIERRRRVNLTNMFIFTIDSKTTKAMDDAISIEEYIKKDADG
jgi:exoribonuclease R